MTLSRKEKTQYPFYCDKELLRRLKEAAKTNHRSINRQIEKYVEDGVNRDKAGVDHA